MRTASTLIGLTLFALAVQARAEEAAPAPKTAPPEGAPPPAAAPAPAAAAAPAPESAAEKNAAPADSTASAPAPVLAAAADQSEKPKRKLEIGIAFLPMGMGRYKNSPDPVRKITSDASFAYGVGLSIGYEVLPHLVVGLAPQVILNVGEKVPSSQESKPARQYDLMGRVAGVLTIFEGTTAYAEVLPGYSIITTPAGPSGFVIAFGLGLAMNVTDRFFVNAGGGYQIGFQEWVQGANKYATSTRYVRAALGAGVRF